MPGETMLIAAALLASGHELDIAVVLPVAFTAAVLGDNVGYAIGRFGGRALVLRLGRRLFVTEEKLAKVEGFFSRRGAIIVVVARFIEILRQLNGIAAGIAGMPWRRFLFFNALGAALWAGFWGTFFYQVGRHGEIFASIYRRFQPFVIGALALGAVVWWGIGRLRAGRDRRKGKDEA